MFPHPCGSDLAKAVQQGADPKTVVPDEFVVVRGGTRAIPSPGTRFSAAAGPTFEAASAAVPHGHIRFTTVGTIRAHGGSVGWVPEYSPHGTLNNQHVHVVECGSTSFAGPLASPVAKKQRIDGGA